MRFRSLEAAKHNGSDVAKGVKPTYPRHFRVVHSSKLSQPRRGCVRSVWQSARVFKVASLV